MLTHDLAITLVAERERAIRDAIRSRGLPPRPSLVSRAWARLAGAMRPRGDRRASPSPRLTPRDLGGAVTMVSARAGDTHGQGAC
jgi:hypothetical protein